MISKFYEFDGGLDMYVGGNTSTVKKYIGCKIITAEPMTDVDFSLTKHSPVIKLGESKEGYKVTYPDGYVSWSPKEVFESAYREITEGELQLIK